MVTVNYGWPRLLVLGMLYAMTTAQSLLLHSICNDLTVIIQTSPTVSSPNITLVNAVYEHLRQVPCLSVSQFLVSLHTKPDDLRPSTQLYEKRLYAWQTEMSNVKLLVWHMNNAEVAITSTIQTVKTKYYLFWEHDWLFCRRVLMEAILLEMEASRNINYVRFNKVVNIPRPPPLSDIVLIPCIKCRFVSLLYAVVEQQSACCQTRLFRRTLRSTVESKCNRTHTSWVCREHNYSGNQEKSTHQRRRNCRGDVGNICLRPDKRRNYAAPHQWPFTQTQITINCVSVDQRRRRM